MLNFRFYLVFIFSSLVFACESGQSDQEANASEPEPTYQLTLASEVQWEDLNPARGDKSPKAATLWGDRRGNAEATGFLLKPIDGFQSPPPHSQCLISSSGDRRIIS
ncbi:MAG: DUF4437 domain-containing protein [Bacteroidota bacterium]